MIDLKKFPKPGVRVPSALRKRVKELVLVLQDEKRTYVNDDLMSMEGVFAAAVLEFLRLDRTAQDAILDARVPELIAMFQAESPRIHKRPKTIVEVQSDTDELDVAQDDGPDETPDPFRE